MQLWLPLLVISIYLITGTAFFASAKAKFSYLWAMALLFLACQLHAFLLIKTVSAGGNAVINLSIFNVVSIFAWTLSCLSFFWLRRPEMALGGVMISLINAVLVFISALLHSSKPFLHASNEGLVWHILLSIAAWTVLSIALIHSVLYLYFFNRLKKKQLRNLKMTALAYLERLSMYYTLIGWAILMLALLSGWMFVNNLFAQHLWHKTVLTMCAAAVYAWVLWSYYAKRRRSTLLIYWSLTAYGILLTGYVVSNVILQFIITKG